MADQYHSLVEFGEHFTSVNIEPYFTSREGIGSRSFGECNLTWDVCTKFMMAFVHRYAGVNYLQESESDAPRPILEPLYRLLQPLDVQTDPVWQKYQDPVFSRVGNLTEEASCSESDVTTYIRTTNPALFAALGGCLRDSTYLLGDPLRMGDEEKVIPAVIENARPQGLKPSTEMASFVSETPGLSSAAGENDKYFGLANYVIDEREVYFHAVTIDENVFYFHHHRNPSLEYLCESVSCVLPGRIIPLYDIFVSIIIETDLRDWHSTQGQLFISFCRDCFEEGCTNNMGDNLLKPRQTRSRALKSAGKRRHHREFAECGDEFHPKEMVKTAAESLHLRLNPKQRRSAYWPKGPIDWTGLKPNSEMAKKLRRQKQFEIECMVEQMERNRTGITNTGRRASSPTLKIVAPTSLEWPEERYKKQGLQKSDRESQRVQKSDDARDPKIGLKADNRSPGADNPKEELICYCREPRGGDTVLHCNSESCQIGGFHFRCSGLARYPRAGESFNCLYCSDTGDFSVSITETTADTIMSDDEYEASCEESGEPSLHEWISEVGEIDQESGVGYTSLPLGSSADEDDKEYQTDSGWPGPVFKCVTGMYQVEDDEDFGALSG